MGHHEVGPEGIPDAFGVASYFVTDFFAESAGPGLVRLYGCARLNGALVAQYVAVMSVQAALQGSALVREMAVSVLHEDGGAVH